jgi:hypothetical protein
VNFNVFDSVFEAQLMLELFCGQSAVSSNCIKIINIVFEAKLSLVQTTSHLSWTLQYIPKQRQMPQITNQGFIKVTHLYSRMRLMINKGSNKCTENQVSILREQRSWDTLY